MSVGKGMSHKGRHYHAIRIKKKSKRRSGALDSSGSISDTERIDWLTAQLVDVIYMDDGRIIDIGGAAKPHDVRCAIDNAIKSNDLNQGER